MEVHFSHKPESHQGLSERDGHRRTLNGATRLKRVSPTNCHPLLKKKKEGSGSLITRCRLKRITAGHGRTTTPPSPSPLAPIDSNSREHQPYRGYKAPVMFRRFSSNLASTNLITSRSRNLFQRFFFSFKSNTFLAARGGAIAAGSCQRPLVKPPYVFRQGCQ